MITQERLKELLHYDPDTGVFTRLQGSGGVLAGDVAGTINAGGYLQIGVAGKLNYGHRLAFLYMTGEIPEVADHINGVRTDNRWVNLRAADYTLNGENRRNRPSGSNPLLGVTWIAGRGKFKAQIGVGKRKIYLGYFTTPEEAHQVHLTAKRDLHAGCTI